MTAPDLPAELKAALDAKLQGLSRNDAAERATLISQTYRAGADAGDLRRGDCKSERAPQDHTSLRASKPARCRRRAGNGDLGRDRSIFIAANLTLLDTNSALRALALDLGGL